MLESGRVPALIQVIDTLNLIARTDPRSVMTIIDTLRIPKSIVYLLLNELRYQRSLSLNHQRNFCLWTRLAELSGHALSEMDLRELARPHSTQLMDTAGLLCRPEIVGNDSAYYILKVESSTTISVRSHRGKSLSLYRSGIGKCLLAWQPEAVQRSIIEKLVQEQMTPTIIIHSQRLYEGLARIRRQGWGYDSGEDYADVYHAAAPVLNAGNKLIAAIPAVDTRLQINEKYRSYLAGRAIACVRDISRLLGWEGPFDLQASQQWRIS